MMKNWMETLKVKILSEFKKETVVKGSSLKSHLFGRKH